MLTISGHVSPRVWRPQNRSSDTKSRKRWISKLKKREREFALPSPFFPFWFSAHWMMPTHIGEVYFFTKSIESNDNLFKTTLIDMPQNNVLPAFWIFFSSLKLTYKISPATAFNYFPSPTEQSLFSLTLMYMAFRTFDHGLMLYCHLIPLSIWILQFKHWKLYCSCSEHWERMHYAFSFSSFANAVFFFCLFPPFFPPHFFMKDKILFAL